MFPLLLLLLSVGIYQVNEIKVEGVRWTSREYVISRAGLSPGPISRSDIQRAIKRLYKDGFYRNIQILLSPVDSVVTLTVSVLENSRVGEVKIEGLKHLKKEDVLDTLGIKSGTYASPEKIFSWARQIEELLREKGYSLARVEPLQKKSENQGFVDIVLRVEEGPPVIIRKIEVYGNESFPDAVLESLLRNKEKEWYRKAKFREEYWEEDLRKIEEFYHNHGFPWARVDSTKKETKDGELYLSIFVTENKKFRFGKIDFEGNKVFSSEFLKENTNLIRERPSLKERYEKFLKGIPWEPTLYSKERVINAQQNIAGFYGDSGYLYVQVIPKEKFREDSIVDITFRIVEGPRTQVRLVDIRGNTKTHDPVIRRELVIFPGDYFSKSKLIQSQRNLFFLNYFANVVADFRETSDTGKIDLIFRVEEKEPGQLGFGGTYSQYEGPGLFFQMQQPNLMGRGQSVSAMIQYSSKTRNYQISFTEPWFKGKPVSVGFDIHDYTRYYPQFREWRQGGSLSYSRRLWNRYSRISYTYRLERQRLFDISMPEQFLGYQKTPALASSTINLSWDVRDRSFNATRGGRFSYEFEISGGILGGEYFPLPLFVVLAAPYSYDLSRELARGAADFHLHIFEATQYLHFSDKIIGVSRVKAGFVSGFSDYNKVPLTRLFWLGDIGPYGLRGYSFASIGPGRLFSILTAELRYRASETIYVGLFADAGQTWRSWESANLAKPWLRSFRRSVGIGFRVEVPMIGIIGIDFAYGLDYPIGPRWQTHFQFGPIGNF